MHSGSFEYPISIILKLNMDLYATYYNLGRIRTIRQNLLSIFSEENRSVNVYNGTYRFRPAARRWLVKFKTSYLKGTNVYIFLSQTRVSNRPR